ncbi:hypothetical protein L6R53_00160 [Myxococcota bacterium]|nr:hypothetical protein [Myxococcota bacterium]
MASLRSLGHVLAPSGRLLLVDAGLLGRLDPVRHAALLSPTASGPVDLDGAGALVITGLPPSARMEVEATAMAEGDDRWAWVCLEVAPGQPATRRELLGQVPVDLARLILVDAVAVSHWQHEQPMDGLADVAFWGADAAALAAELGVPTLPDGTFGWQGVPADQALAWARHLDGVRGQGGRRFAFDYRPHSHHWQLMEQVRQSPVQAGQIELAGALACGFMTTWGDGVFPVHAEYSATGALVRLRVQLTDAPLPALAGPPRPAASPPPAGPASSALPSTPQEAAAAALKTAARDAAQRRVEGWLYRQVKPYLPETILKRLQKQAEQQVSSLIWGCAFLVIFVMAFGGVAAFIAAAVAWSLLTG